MVRAVLLFDSSLDSYCVGTSWLGSVGCDGAFFFSFKSRWETFVRALDIDNKKHDDNELVAVDELFHGMRDLPCAMS